MVTSKWSSCPGPHCDARPSPVPPPSAPPAPSREPPSGARSPTCHRSSRVLSAPRAASSRGVVRLAHLVRLVRVDVYREQRADVQNEPLVADAAVALVGVLARREPAPPRKRVLQQGDHCLLPWLPLAPAAALAPLGWPTPPRIGPALAHPFPSVVGVGQELKEGVNVQLAQPRSVPPLPAALPLAASHLTPAPSCALAAALKACMEGSTCSTAAPVGVAGPRAAAGAAGRRRRIARQRRGRGATRRGRRGAGAC